MDHSNHHTILMKHNNLPVCGIGNDIIEVERLQKSLDRQGQPFYDRLFTDREQQYCRQFKEPMPHFAGRFAAKEAIAKALGTGLGARVQWQDIEVLNDALGKPIVFLSETLQKEFDNPHLLVSISHTASYATAVAIWLNGA
jgi:holo-[acyl-carrier protein] synthase